MRPYKGSGIQKKEDDNYLQNEYFLLIIYLEKLKKATGKPEASS